MIDFIGIYRLDESRNSMFLLAEALEIIFMVIFQELWGTQVRNHAKNVSFVSYLFRS